eukprot:TRINITY_DN1542_c0_g1_i14.p2 TRINITY_DN1542_c0_g1~~TRINITY_DN1542_c0_g1_i14.p2  ORF type:complete len:198 (-),score=29.03 TRINITY_DN1542_c0_g1_i14:114-707(-)
MLEEFYLNICDNIPAIHRMTPESAEIAKIAINCFITTKIAFANLVGDTADKTPNADPTDILRAVGGDSRIGSKYLSPGYGFGGPCFPRDNRALGNYMKSIGVDPIIPYATDEANKFHATFMVKNFLDQDLDLYKFTDVCYKDNCSVPIIEESQKLAVARGLVRAGKRVLIIDKGEVIRNVQSEFGNIFEYEIVDPES